MLDRDAVLLEEYKLCQQSMHEKDRSIWTTFGFLGAGTLASFAILVRDPNPTALGAILAGIVGIAASWIWWVIAKRWWQLEHTDLLRMRHIEETLAARFGSPLRIGYGDTRDGFSLPALLGVPPEFWQQIPIGIGGSPVDYPLPTERLGPTR